MLQGELQSGQALLDGYTIRLYDVTHHATLETSDIRPDGAFEFRQIPYGSYVVTVTNPRGNAVYQGSVTVSGVPQPLIVRLPSEEICRPASGPISVKQLQHPPSRKAFDAFQQAQKFGDAGDAANSEQWLRKAIQLSPEFGEAWLNLGAQHMKAGLFQQSIDETRRAMEWTGPTAAGLSNLAYALARLGRLTEGREAAEQAVRLKPGDAHANYILGAFLQRLHHMAPLVIVAHVVGNQIEHQSPSQ